MSGSGYQPEETDNEEQERLLSHDVEMTHMADLNPNQSIEEGQSHVESRYEDDESCREVPSGQLELDGMEFPAEGRQIEYKVYKRRWFGLMQLVLLNIVVSWDVSISIH
jgi:hypothetical protein